MSLKKYSFASIFFYGLIFISPLILASIGLVKTTPDLITATAVAYILCWPFFISSKRNH